MFFLRGSVASWCSTVGGPGFFDGNSSFGKCWLIRPHGGIALVQRKQIAPLCSFSVAYALVVIGGLAGFCLQHARGVLRWVVVGSYL